jgi:hypothetical protein
VGQRSGPDPDATGRENLEMQTALYGLHGSVRRAASCRTASPYSRGSGRR